ncbi:MAG: hypothetical protein AAB785_01955 [Patescibacteria group bacterium]
MNRIDKLNQILKYWQQFLNLQQWNLKIKLVDFKRKDYPQTGDIKVDLRNKSATILVSEKETGKDNATILHELIHLILWEFDHLIEESLPKNKKDGYFELLEKTVADLTRIFLEKERKTC